MRFSKGVVYCYSETGMESLRLKRMQHKLRR
ncbi:hypothetical protein HRbin17_01502 [bacterium HR17]|uniref:Uncharacterized protein n=1 Tax=Candidatus Fervidibacter japonicus TaxID=2035412 RepID=A0A2H5XCS6_9BACT|nr:hypothetical protein HRbin17_01502 [bacterium HR17]